MPGGLSLLTVRQWLPALCVRALERLQAALHHVRFGEATHAWQAEGVQAGGAAEVRSCRIDVGDGGREMRGGEVVRGTNCHWERPQCGFHIPQGSTLPLVMLAHM